MTFVPPRRAPGRRTLSDPADVQEAAAALAAGRFIAHGFANFYAITTAPDPDTVGAANLAKGRPADQVGSVAVPPALAPGLFDWAAVAARGGNPDAALLGIDALLRAGPAGFRGPASPRIPAHLTQVIDGVRTVQFVSPGYLCPANGFFAAALRASGSALLHITSANRSRHVTGSADEPPHHRAIDLRADLGAAVDVLEHADEAAAARAYPAYRAMSTSIVSFGVQRMAADDTRPVLTLERQGSLSPEAVRALLDPIGVALAVSAGAAVPLTARP